MEDKIEVGEYVRTKDGKIDKVINSNFYMSIYVECEKGLCLIESIVKHSKQLIGLIKCGDFVNGHKVKAIYLNGATKYIKLDNAYENGQGTRTYEETIKTILTKEQYEANCYKVGGEN